jgi:hypothetical protein
MASYEARYWYFPGLRDDRRALPRVGVVRLSHHF